MDSKPPLPLLLVESLFARLAISYGHPFLNQYEGFDMGPVHRDWAEKLAVYGVRTWDASIASNVVTSPAIDWALDNLPAGRPVNALDFKALCRAYHGDDGQQLALPAPPREVPARIRAECARLSTPSKDRRPERVRIAERLVAKHGAPGAKLSPMQRAWLKHAREILRLESGAPGQDWEGSDVTV